MPKHDHRAKPVGDYHHGNLRAALLSAAMEVLTEKGVIGFSLRETARRAGVTPAAPKHHFADTRALLTELAAIAFEELADRLEAADAGAASQSLGVLAQGEAYISYALEQRSLFELMWQSALLDLEDKRLQAQKFRAFDILDKRVRGAGAQQLNKDDEGMAPTLACWSIGHGFAHMAIEGAFGLDWEHASKAARMLLARSLELFCQNVLDQEK